LFGGFEMQRREFIALLGGASVWPVAARAQQTANPVIGFLSGRSSGESQYLVAEFVKGLREAGFVVGQNVSIESQWADGQYDRLPAQAADFVRRNVALIVAVGAVQAILAAKAATSTIPVVFHTGNDPVRLGLVASLNRPGGNLTGTSSLNEQIESKRVEILDQLVPKGAILAMLVNPNAASIELQIKEVEAAARALGHELHTLKATNADEIDSAFSTHAQRGYGALLLGSDPFLASKGDQIVALAERYKIPTLSYGREFTAAGGLVSYGASIANAYRQTGVYAGRILKGEKPGDLPVTQATKIDLVLNLKTAKALGIEFPDRLIALADEVIE
jgi:putative ABC transport system substrate-binding protein